MGCGRCAVGLEVAFLERPPPLSRRQERVLRLEAALLAAVGVEGQGQREWKKPRGGQAGAASRLTGMENRGYPCSEDVLQAAVQHRQPDLDQQVGAAPAPTHRLLLAQFSGKPWPAHPALFSTFDNRKSRVAPQESMAR
jgi:hypothetical protein